MDFKKGKKKKTLLTVMVFLVLILIPAVMHGRVFLSHDYTYGYTLHKLKSDYNNRYHQTETSQQMNDFQAIIFRNAERKQRLQEQCRSVSQSSNRTDINRHEFFRKDTVRFLTNPGLSLVYCRVNKAASTYTFQTLVEIFNCTKECFQHSSERIRRLHYERKKKTLDGAYKFMFVREPYGRLFSTYCNKFYFPKGYWDPIGKDIVLRFREKPSEDSLKYGHDVTFAELIRYTIEDFEAGNKMEEHIRPMHTNCKPCDYEYDFIGKLETMKSDWKYLAHEWKSRNITTNIPTDIGEISRKAFGEMKYVLRTLKRVKESKIDLYDLYQRAWNYYQITSVISKHIEMPFSRIDNKNISYELFLQQLSAARERSAASSTKIKAQKHEAMLQAYSTVPLKDLERLKNVVKEDCLLFGYDESPEWLFGGKTLQSESNTFNYFSGISRGNV